MIKYTVKTASGLLALHMRACKFDGWASFWCVIYVLPGFESDQRLLRHERKHLGADRARVRYYVAPSCAYGRLLFAVRYLWWTMRHEYWNKLMTPDERKTLICEIVEVM